MTHYPLVTAYQSKINPDMLFTTPERARAFDEEEVKLYLGKTLTEVNTHGRECKFWRVANFITEVGLEVSQKPKPVMRAAEPEPAPEPPIGGMAPGLQPAAPKRVVGLPACTMDFSRDH